VYYGGRPEPVHPFAAVLGAVVGGAAGVVVGFFGFLIATFFPHLLRTALPQMEYAPFLVLWMAALMVPVLWFRSVWIGGRGIGTKVFACCGIAVVTALFVGDITGLVRAFPWDQRFFIVPAIERPDTSAPAKH
jgi:hypothetical protein